MNAVYWIRHPEMKYHMTEGYVGISNNPKGRFHDHKSQPWFDDRCEMMILQDGLTRQEAIDIEKLLRPKMHIGWNKAPGGGDPPQGLNKGKKFGKINYPKTRKSSARMKVYTICKHCGTERLRPSYEHHRQFCSPKCGNEHKKGKCYHTPEFLARLAEDMKGNQWAKKTDANLSS